MRILYTFLLVLILTINLESKEMKIIYFYTALSEEIQGKIIYSNKVVNIKDKIAFDDTNKKFWWKYSNPIFLEKQYIAIKTFRYLARSPYYTDYSIHILDKDFNSKEILYEVRNKDISNLAYNSAKKIIAFTVAEEEEKDDGIFNIKSFLNIYDLAKRKVILTREMGKYNDNLDLTARAFNSTSEYICIGKSTTKKGWDGSYGTKDYKVILYDIKNNKETVIAEGQKPSFITDNIITFIDKDFRRIYLYDLTAKKSEEYFSCSFFRMITRYFISPDNKQIIIDSTNRYMVNKGDRRVLYDFNTKKEIKWDMLNEINYALHIDWQFVD